jgi:hypothetical protein
MERVPGDLGRARVLTPAGETVDVADFWKEKPAVLAFVRHFG